MKSQSSDLWPDVLRSFVLVGVLFASSACRQADVTGPAITPTEIAPAASPTTLKDVYILPVLEESEPDPAIIGEELKIIGRGGYKLIETEAGSGYDESYREFELYLEGESIGTLGCYVNRCEGVIELPATLEAGSYELSVEGGSSLTIDAEQ